MVGIMGNFAVRLTSCYVKEISSNSCLLRVVSLKKKISELMVNFTKIFFSFLKEYHFSLLLKEKIKNMAFTTSQY